MSAPTNRWKLGLFIVVGSVLAVTAAGYFGTRSLRKETVNYTSYFDESVTGLESGSPVKFRGVTIGNVSKIDVAPDRRHVEITYELGVSVLGRLGLATGEGQHTTLQLPPDLRAQLGSSGLTGLKYISIDFFDVASNPAPVLPFPLATNCIPVTPSTMKSLEDSVIRAVEQFPTLAADVILVLDHVNRLLTELEEQHLPRRATRVLDNADQTLASLQTKLEEIRTKELSSDAQRAFEQLARMTTEIQTLVERFNGERGIANSVQRATDRVGDVATNTRSFGPELSETLRDVREASNAVRQLAQSLDLDSDMLLKGRAKASAP